MPDPRDSQSYTSVSFIRFASVLLSLVPGSALRFGVFRCRVAVPSTRGLALFLWTVGTSPNAELVNTMLDNAIVLLKENEHPIVHSDRGCHYRWSGWIQRMDEAGLTRSMSKKGCSPDNSACEGFFGRMKNEMFYGEKWDKISVEEFISIINQYMQWYRDKRIKLSLGGLSPMEYRRSLGIA